MKRRWAGGIVLAVLLVVLLVPPVPARGAAPGQSTGVHVVAWGETLFSIARRYGTSVGAIQSANGLADPTRIYAGQRLVIPTSGAADDSGSLPTAVGASHIVQPGENLYRIARRYGTTVQALTQVNGLYNPDHVAVGQKLVIPGSSTTPSI